MKLNVELLKSFRARKNLTLEAAGQLIGVSRQAWHSWETGLCFPFQHLDKLAALLETAQANLLIEDNAKRRSAR